MPIVKATEVGETGLQAEFWVLIAIHSFREGAVFRSSAQYELWASEAAYLAGKQSTGPRQTLVLPDPIEPKTTMEELEALFDQLITAPDAPLESGAVTAAAVAGATVIP